jgi:hypothetical protein
MPPETHFSADGAVKQATSHGPFGPGQCSFKTDVTFSNTLQNANF